MDATEALLFGLIRQRIFGAAVVSVSNISGLYRLAQRHELAHLIGDALESGAAIAGGFQERLIEAHYRSERYLHAYEELRTCFEQENVQFIPLKGLVLRELYPEPWMRTSCDMDLLLHPEDMERAAKILEDTLQYRPKAMSAHDLSFISSDGVRVELHHTLIEGNPVLEKVWDHCQDNRMDEDYFYLYHIAHMAKHFLHGGCGIRPVLDLRLMEQRGMVCPANLLEQCGLLTFANAMRRLAAYWFGGEEPDRTVLEIHEYILRGGVFGTDENQHLLGRMPAPDKSRILVSARELEYSYPVLKRHRWLLPVCQLRRWGSLLFGEKARRRRQSRRSAAGLTEQQRQQAASLLNRLGL